MSEPKTANLKCEYFGGWHRYYKEPVVPLSEAQARERHSKGEPYCAVIRGNGAEDSTFIEVTVDYFGVNFLDAKSRVYLTYGFEDAGAQRLFLKQAIYREFAADGDQPTKVTSYYFKEDGSLTIERTAPTSHAAEVTEGRCDVSMNWASRPAFGRYEDLLRKERQIAASYSAKS